MDLGRLSAAALMLSGLAGATRPERVATALDLPATTGRARAETRAGLGGTYAALGGWALLARHPIEQGGVGVAWLGAAAARLAALRVDQPDTDWTSWAFLAAELGFGASALAVRA